MNKRMTSAGLIIFQDRYRRVIKWQEGYEIVFWDLKGKLVGAPIKCATRLVASLVAEVEL